MRLPRGAGPGGSGWRLAELEEGLRGGGKQRVLNLNASVASARHPYHRSETLPWELAAAATVPTPMAEDGPLPQLGWAPGFRTTGPVAALPDSFLKLADALEERTEVLLEIAQELRELAEEAES